MWPAFALAVIAGVGTVFMVRFLIALLQEGTPSVCYWVVAARLDPQKQGHLEVLPGIHLDDGYPATECRGRDDGFEFVENQIYAKEECSSGLITLDVRRVCDTFGGRSVQPGRGNVFRQRQL